MKIDSNLNKLPLTKTNPATLKALFGSEKMTPFWVADMEFEIAKPIQDALINRIKNSGFGYEYKPRSFFEAQQKWYLQNYKLDLQKFHQLFSPTISTSIAVLIENFSEEGDGIIIQPPVFMEFRDIIRKTKRKIIKNSLKLVNKQYVIDYKDLAEKAKQENTKILILCNPHNPVGRVWTKEELQEIVSLCKKNNVLLISDEIHKDIILFKHTFTSVLQFSATYNQIVVCTSEAKTFNLCGISDAMLFTPNNTIKKAVSDTFKKYNLGRTNALTRVAIETAYLNGKPWLEKVIHQIEENVISIEKELQNSKINLIKPEGTFQVWLDFRNVFTNTKEMFEVITKKTKIALNAGHWFGREGALFMRMNIATSNEKVLYAIRLLKNAVE